MDNKNLTALNALTALIANDESLIQGTQGKIDSMKIAKDIINGLYVADTEWRDAQVQLAKDAVAKELTDALSRADTAEATVATLQAQLGGRPPQVEEVVA